MTLLAYPDATVADVTIVSGGAWSGTLPLANLKDQLLKKVARSTDLAAASTTFIVNLGNVVPVQIVALLAHNISVNGTIRVRGYADAGLTNCLYDSGSVRAWPFGFTADMVADYPSNWIYPLPASYPVQYWQVDISDLTNPAGYVQLGRCWLGPVFAPVVPIVYGATLGYDIADEINEAIGAVDWVTIKSPRRRVAMTFPELTAAEKRTVLIMQKTMGKHGEFLWVMDAGQDESEMLLQAFPARLYDVSPFSFVDYNRNELPIGIREIV